MVRHVIHLKLMFSVCLMSCMLYVISECCESMKCLLNLCKALIPQILSQCKSHVHQHIDLSVNILAMIPEYIALLASSAEFDAVEQLSFSRHV